MKTLEWLETRKKGIGGSDAAAVCGVSPWVTPLQLYMEKISDEVIQSEQTQAMEWGNILEPVLRQQYANRTGRQVIVPEGIHLCEEYPWMVANFDGLTPDERIVEIKTARTATGWGEPGSNEIPQHYLLQVQHYMAVTLFPVADVAVLIGGNDFRIYEIEADLELQELLIKKEQAFWKRVEDRNPPDPISMTDINQMYRVSNPNNIEATEDVLEQVNKLKEIRASIKAMEFDEESLITEIKAYIGENDTLSLNNNPLVTWKTSKGSKKFDKETFQKDNPELYENYLIESQSSRRFLLK